MGEAEAERMRPPVPHGSPDDWWWQERNEWGFEGWVPTVLDDGDDFNSFTSVHHFEGGIEVVIRPSGFDGEALSWLIPSMPSSALELWLRDHTPAFDLQQELDEFFEEILEDFAESVDRPAGSTLFFLSDYDAVDNIEVMLLADGSFAAWSNPHRALLRFNDFCELRRVYEAKLTWHWSPKRMDPEWEARWDSCAETSL